MSETQRAKERAIELWIKMCQWDNVAPDCPFVVFSDTNPYQGEYDAVITYLKATQQQEALCLTR